jgi:hypothetical protein
MDRREALGIFGVGIGVAALPSWVSFLAWTSHPAALRVSPFGTTMNRS